ncbi:MAG: TolC family outer membrane protein [Betaproteobacteria bacterium]|nr:TolC family outer membrane protein [Betaproteobacteria bacterium]
MKSIALRTLIPLTLFCAQAHSADLLEVYRQALAQDPVYASARYAFEAAKETIPQARAGLLPTVTLNGNYLRNHRNTEGVPTLDFNTNSYSLSLNQPGFRMQNWIAFQQAGLQAKQAEAVFADAQQNIIVRVAQAYFDVLLAQDNVTLSGAQKAAVSEQLAQAKRNFEVGTSTIVDTYEAQSRYDLAAAKEIADRNDLEIKQRALQQLVGKLTPSLAVLRDKLELPLPAPNDMEQWVSSSEQTSPTIAQSQATYEVARKEIERNRAGHYPTLDFVTTYSENTTPTSNAFGQLGPSLTTKSTQFGIQVSVPIFQGGGTQSRVRQSISNRDKSAQDLENTKRVVAQNVRQSFLGVTNGVAQVKALEAALVSSQASLDSTKLGKDVGVRTNVDVLNSQQQLFQARRDLQQARYNTILSQLRLKSAVGRLGEDDVAEVNRMLQN